MAKITKISLQNFKFFRQREEYNTEGKHLLIYGENGSGKSSFYWALYTLLECANKDDDASIEKYFIAGGEWCLANIFLQNGQPDFIESEIKFDFDDGTFFRLAANDLSIRGNAEAQASNYASEFLNYRMLFRIHDFFHSSEINLFEYFVREVFSYVKFAPVRYWKKKSDGSLEDHETGNAKQIWEFVKNGTPKSSVNANGDKRFPQKKEPEYAVYNNIVNGFKTELQSLLTYINTEGNPILKDEFEGDFEFRLELKETKPYKIIAQKFTPPEFSISLVVLNFYGSDPIRKPHSFLNEARLSALGLSMRFAILKQRIQTAKVKLALLDDFMISLDMNNRDVALNYVFDKVAADYQTIILTHDRYFFEMAKKKLKAKGMKDWKFYEMYEHINENSPNIIEPFKTESLSYLEKADKHLKLHEYETAGNFLRKEAEAICKEFMPRRLQYDKDNKRLDLSPSLARCISFFDKNGIDKTNLEKLNDHRDILLNASSHDSYDVPKFRNELVVCLKNIEEIRKIKAIPILEEGEILEFEFLMFGGRKTFKFEILIHDEIFLFKEDGMDSKITSGVINYHIYKDGVKGILQFTDSSIKQIYDGHYRHSDRTKDADFWEGIVIKSSGNKLKSLRKF